MKIQISSTQGLSGGSSLANRADRKGHVREQIAAHVSDGQASGVLQRIQYLGQNKTGYLRLDGAGGTGALRFSDRWNVWPWRSAKGEVTGAAIKALFKKIDLPSGELDSFLALNANREISLRQMSSIISNAQRDKMIEARLPAIKQELDVRKLQLKAEIANLWLLPEDDPGRQALKDDLQIRVDKYRAELSDWRSRQSNLQARITQNRIGGDPGLARAELKDSLDMYRSITFRGVEVGGGARPAGSYLKNTDSTAEVYAQLHTAGYRTILSIDSSKETNEMHADVPSDLKFQRFFHWAPLAESDLAAELDSPLEPTDYGDGSAYVVGDFSAPTLEALMGAVDMVAEASQEGEPVFIHCGGGAGRTGTFLAALMIVDQLSQARQKDPKFDPRSEPQVEFLLETSGWGDTKGPAYPFVANIIKDLRQQDNSRQGYPSVETEGQLKVLNEFLERLSAL
jgi:hypothetical protein